MWGKSVEYLEVSGMVVGVLCCLLPQSPCGPCHQSAVDLVPSQPFKQQLTEQTLFRE